jgi:hypothetical protein
VSTLLRAGVAWGEGKQGESIHWLGRAVAELDGAELTLLAECARRRLGQLIGGDEGRLLVGRSEAFMRAQGVVEPGSLTRALVPGYDPFDG